MQKKWLEVYGAYRIAELLAVYADCSPQGFYQRWKQRNDFMDTQAESYGCGATDGFMDAVEQTVSERRNETSWKNEDAWKAGTAAYGVRYMTPEMYLYYELKSIQLAFVVYKGDHVGTHKCHVYTDEEKREFYEKHPDLFTRYHGDLFSYEEVAVIIEKWLKASEYQEIVRETATELLSDEEAGGVQMSGETLLQRVNAVDAEKEVTDAVANETLSEACVDKGAETWTTEFRSIWNRMQHQKEDAESRKAAENSGRCYYVSALRGDDANDGTESQPLRSLYAVNRLKLQPGDQVFLERGSVFEGQFLHLSVQGSKEHPIRIGAYGNGARPLIETNGQGIWYQDYGTELDAPTHVYRGYVSSAVLLYDCEYITVADLEITNRGGVFGEDYSAPHKMNRTGVAGIAKDRGTLHEIHLNNLFIHDVEGNVYDKHMNNGGIYFTCLKPEDEAQTGVARYENVSVRGCHLKHTSRWGIAVGYSYKCKEFMMAELPDELFAQYGHHNIYIADNYVEEIGGDGITVMYAMKPLVEYNSGDSCALEMNDRYYREPENRGGKVAAGIWPWKCKDALLTYNEMRDMRLNQDSMAWDADSGDGTLYQYNYSRLNEGGCVMFCLEEAIHNEFRYNVSMDDLGGLISPSGNPDAWIHHNVFYHRKEVPFLRAHMDDGRYTVEENEIKLI
ncbi:hypothetical protein [uncultured Eubacterium sp.]|uniref:hypothetical protein n=1 Tax=uncultured Eubacterium sp. TaxID=165185 RepID=UPI0025EE55F4|nr:hypothetical protein [uncultured Eubacterium sp.]